MQNTFLLAFKNKVLRVAPSDTWNVMNKGINLKCSNIKRKFFSMSGITNRLFCNVNWRR